MSYKATKTGSVYDLPIAKLPIHKREAYSYNPEAGTWRYL